MQNKIDHDTLPATVRWPHPSSKSDIDKFHKAVLTAKCKKIRKLVSSGVSPDVRNGQGQTGLFVAAYVGNKQVVKLLLKLGANPNGRCVPQGYTPVHGACFIGSISTISALLAFGGDLRLTDTNRQRPIDWIEFQEDPYKRKITREFIERLRYCVILQSNQVEMKAELKGRIDDQGRSWLGAKIRKLLGNRSKQLSSKDLTAGGIMAGGFGNVYFGNGPKCSGVIGVPVVRETPDLSYDGNPTAPSWINGKFSTFIPMTWDKRNVSVTCKSLRNKSVEEAVPDILIAELAAVVRLQHPNLLMLLAICQEENGDSLSLVFEKVGLGSLYHFLHQQHFRMKSTFANDIVIQISEALDFIHGSGFLHCGISSHAIMLVSENHVKLSCLEYAIPEDPLAAEAFVSSRHPWLDSDSHLSVIRHWAAPEVLLGTHRHSQASDVYSLCSVMWELVVGDVPWNDYDLESLRLMLKESQGLQLQLRKDVIPPLWMSVLKVGLKRKREERDLDFKEVRYMMTLAKERSSASSTSGDKRNSSKGSLRSSALLSSATAIPSVAKTTASPSSTGGQGDLKRLSKINVVTEPPPPELGIDEVDEVLDDKMLNIPRSEQLLNISKTMSKASLPRSYKSEAYLQI